MIKKFFSKIDQLLFKIPLIGPRLYLRQLSKFIIAGAIATGLDFSVYIFLTRCFIFWQAHYLGANFIALSLGAIVSFCFNKFWVFKNKGKKIMSQYLRFWVVGGIGGMIFYQYLLFLFVEHLQCHDLFSKFFSAVIILIFHFSLQKFWIFKN